MRTGFSISRSFLSFTLLALSLFLAHLGSSFGATNVAAQANGAVASSSSVYGAGYAPSSVINGDRRGANWGKNGGWIDGTPTSFPDWVQITFAGVRTIGQVDVFTIQDNWQAPAEPTPTMTFTQYGITNFQVQYWTGSAWTDVPGGHITSNNLVWRRLTFSAISTDRIRVLINAGSDGYSRLAEVEAWSTATITSVNAASQARGAVATASSVFGAGYAASSVNNGERRGAVWGQNGGWIDGTPTSFPDWVQIDFAGAQSIAQIDVFTIQDNWKAPAEPTPQMTFTQYGNRDFHVQYWTGTAWADVPGGHIVGNNLIWRRLVFTPITTERIRVLVTAGTDGYSRLAEVEAWTAAGGEPQPNTPPTISLTAPMNNVMLTAPATVNLSANAGDADGAVSRVEFYRDGVLIGTATTPTSGTPASGTWTFSDTSVGVGTYIYTARAFDSGTPAAMTTSGPRLANVSAVSASSVNVALQANGGVATSSSVFGAGYSPSSANNGDRRGAVWGQNGGWIDGTPTAFPDWVQINFAGARTIGQIDVFTIQDNWQAPAQPTPQMTFTQYGNRDFHVQYWTGSAWNDVPDGHVTGNNLIWRRFAFDPISTDRIRVLVTAGTDGYSRLAEVEAWTIGAPPPVPPTLTLQQVAAGFSSPLGIANARDGSNRLFVVQQGGQIRIISGTAVLATPFLNITSLVLSGGERGLLGLAFHPDYANNGFFYVNYTRAGDGATVIARYQRSATNPNVADPASATILLTVAQPFANHNGGQLNFGPDGYLYIALGDGGSGNDPGDRAQNLSTLLGKMLRIDVDNGSPYAIPAGNPFPNAANPKALPEIWAYGLRNPWRFSFDRATGDLFIADVGQNAWEELNFQAAGTGAGANYGWRIMEGAHCTGLTSANGLPCFDARLKLPIIEYGHSLGCSITGGYRYRGSASPALTGYLLYGDYCSGRIWGATPRADGTWMTTQLTTAGINISTFGEDEAGEIYVAGHNTGTIYRIRAQ